MATPTTPGKKPRTPRRKACGNCARSKARCSLEKPACSRCRLTDRSCVYETAALASEQRNSGLAQGGLQAEPERLNCPRASFLLDSNSASTTLQTPVSLSDASAPSWLPVGDTICYPPSQQLHGQCIEGTVGNNELAFGDIDLTPTSEADKIRSRWLRPYFMTTLDRIEIPKVVLPYTIQFIKRILRTYPRNMLEDGHLPPIIHQAQVKGSEVPRALANCYSLVRMWEHAVPGSEEVVMSTLRREMDRLSSESPDQHDYQLLCSFQAYLIYSILMYFSPRGNFSENTMIALMDLAFRTSRNGLSCTAEIERTKPTWESWIVAAAKRRAVFILYVFSSIYNADRMLPDFIADELRTVYVPGHKALWEADNRETWNKVYYRYLSDWEDGSLVISELWAFPEKKEPKRRERIERWVGTVDEFGMMMFALCAHIHGC
ncbi:hypothetical protein ASPVEDRAFT_133782 [Aspergillus versicolor CBS 583.65]|uniref:Zn(2)-C6 fungal-type domain-containing protein n=1 Tax=Aspergillus versicolor CBS 583.65 TaxID=1036611 RepID=A0A1L9PNM9_ASPVE|nr:uncharacterized protein ASPVEDRAFT_133782 [Aspergillus versicolor CBS 583.65]OJJ03121.1 hypothetical protein ASPVEDRAFT_133782 [Aspergillus versicolor CBS 583.65]